jgi:hypothetical protein
VRRTRDQIDRDRADLEAVLEEAQGPLYTHRLIARALGYPSADDMWVAYPWPEISQALRDLDVLRRQGRLVSRADPGRYQVEWRLATREDLDNEDDRVEVSRMYARWQEADS